MRIFNLPVYRIDSSVVFPFAFFNMAIARLIAHVALKMDLSVPFGGGKPAAAAVRGEFGAAVHLRLWGSDSVERVGNLFKGVWNPVKGVGNLYKGFGNLYKRVGNV